MLLRSIVGQLDTELNRLHTLREIVAKLKGTPAALRKLSPPVAKTIEIAVNEVEAVVATPVSKRRAPAKRVLRGRRPAASRGKEAEPTPLKHAIPRGPVVILPDQLARERAHRVTAREQTQEPAQLRQEDTADLDGQSRALASRWISNSLAS